MQNHYWNTIKRYVRWFGIAVTIVSLVFVSNRITLIIDDLSNVRLSWSLILSMAISLIGLIIGQFCVGGILWQSFRFLGFKLKPQLPIYATLRSQIAKYLPGNVFHFGGCIALLRLEGIPIKESIMGLGVQYGSLIIVALILGVPFWINWEQSQLISIVGLIGLMSVVSILIFLLRRYKETRIFSSNILLHIPKGEIISFVNSVILACLFFLFSGLSLYLITFTLSSNYQLPILPILASFSLSWIAGMIVLGSPGGLGVRESVFILLLSEIMDQEIVTLAFSIHRLLRIGNDRKTRE